MKGRAEGVNFLADLYNYARRFDMTEFVVVTQGRSVFLGVNHAHNPKGRAPASPKIRNPQRTPTATKYDVVTLVGE